MGSMERPCIVCVSPARYQVEQAYMNGEAGPIRAAGFSRVAMDRHMAHLTDADTLKQVTSMASGAAVAARLAQLEIAAKALIDEALTPKAGRRMYKGQPVTDEHGRPLEEIDTGQAVMALREARAVIETMSKLVGHLGEKVEAESSRPDLDAMIARTLGMDADASPQADRTDEKVSPQALELLPGTPESAPV